MTFMITSYYSNHAEDKFFVSDKKDLKMIVRGSLNLGAVHIIIHACNVYRIPIMGYSVECFRSSHNDEWAVVKHNLKTFRSTYVGHFYKTYSGAVNKLEKLVGA